VRDIIAGQQWNAGSARFPRVTLCDFEIRQMGNNHRHTVQCVLPINLFNEKIFLFLWFWIVGLIIITSISFLSWFVRMIIATERRHYVRQHLRFMKKLDSDQDKKKARRFIDNYLRPDGVFVLRLVAKNTDTITVTEFIGELWKNFTEKGRNDDPVDTEDQSPGEGCCSRCRPTLCCVGPTRTSP